MRVLVIGSNGFVGSYVCQALADSHTVVTAGRSGQYIDIDLNDVLSISKALITSEPDVIINCAGIVGANQDITLNRIFTENLLNTVHSSGKSVKKIIISGSAAEYGHLADKDIPVSESTPTRASAGYALSKKQETETALKLAQEYHLQVLIARIFNPIGSRMGPKFLVSNILAQVTEIKEGNRQSIEISRADSRRDYIDIRDIASAFKALVDGDPIESVYNIGSGKSTSNKELISTILKYSGVDPKTPIVETSPDKEPLVAIQADVTRLKSEFDWKPKYSLETTVKDIVYESRS